MWNPPRTWNAGETVTAVLMNQQVRDNLNILKTSIDDDGKIRALSAAYLADLSGNDLLITGLPKTFRQTADVTKNANTTPADLPGLAFPVAANEDWHFNGTLFIISSVAADIRLALTGPSSPTAVIYQALNVTNPGAVATAFGSNVVAQGLAAIVQVVLLCGTVRNGANAGTVQIQGAQNASDATSTIFKQNSFLVAHRSA